MLVVREQSLAVAAISRWSHARRINTYARSTSTRVSLKQAPFAKSALSSAETRALIVVPVTLLRSHDPAPYRICDPQRQDDGAKIVPDTHRSRALEPAGARILGMHQE